MNAIDDACSALQSRLAELSVLIHVLSVGEPTAPSDRPRHGKKRR